MKLSRIGREPVNWPSDVQVCVSDCTISVEGPKGKISRRLPQLGSLQVRFFDPEGRETIYSNNASSLILEIPKPKAPGGSNTVQGLNEALEKSKIELFSLDQASISSYPSRASVDLREYPHLAGLLGLEVLGYKSQSDKLLSYGEYKSLVGSYRTTIYNLVVGVTTGFCKKLKLVGVGYKAEVHENVDEKIGKKVEQGIYCGGKKTALPSHLINDFNSLRSEYQKCLLKAFSIVSDPHKRYSSYDNYFWRLYQFLFTEDFCNRLRKISANSTSSVSPEKELAKSPECYNYTIDSHQEKKILEEIREEMKSIVETTYLQGQYPSTLTPTRMIYEVFELSKDFYERMCIIASPEPSLLEKAKEAKNTILLLRVGYSHPVGLIVPQGLEAKVDGSTMIISGISKEKVTSFAAKVRCVRPPEPYKGKGILYEGEFVRRKAGKTAKSGKSGK
jgi:ribosomal protein L6P/L9E